MNTRQTLFLCLSFVAAATLASCDSARALTRQKTNTLQVMGTRFRKPAAYRADMLWVGDKVNEAGRNMLATYDFVRIGTPGTPTNITAIETVLIIDEEKSWSGGLNLSELADLGLAKAEAKADSKKVSKGFFDIKEIMSKRELLEELNSPKNRSLLEHMFYRMNAPRIVTAVAKVGKSDIKDFPSHREETNSGGTFSAKVNLMPLAGIPGDFEFKSEGRHKINSSFSTGTIVGYKLSVPAWRMEGGRPVIVDYVEDVQGMFRQFEAKAIRGAVTDRSELVEAQ
jgi:hypothetical protein